jgi:hypothetical protein
LVKEKTTLDGDITKLRDGLSTNTTTQSVDRKTGQVITKANNANRKSFEGQLKEAQVRRDTIASRIDDINDSITKLDIQVLDMESEEISGSELGVIKYVSELLDWDIKRTANLFILILIFVFDPLAITLVIATNQAFKSRRKEDTDKVEDNVDLKEIDSPKQEEDPPKEILKVEDNVDLKEIDSPKQEEEFLKVEDNVDTDEVKRVWDKVKELREEGKLPPKPTEEELNDEPTALAFTPYEVEETEEVISDKNLEQFVELQDTDKTQIEESTSEPTVDNKNPKKLSYLNRDGYGKSLRIDRF